MTAHGEFPTSRSRSAFRIFRISIDSSGPASASRHVTCAAPEAVPHDPCFAYFAARAHTEELKHLAFAPSQRGRERDLRSGVLSGLTRHVWVVAPALRRS